ncbi:uncharacterized protein LOC127858436 [Dreissena polymorpha]|uniref:uncharacterized protein LOC127858436 n=1 Tax=Dreissena polymorpha TaxID=45954 RepID=UPI0022644FC1|nr:uncharacterized protein LOC127858436 [Dreissena polymorpha]
MASSVVSVHKSSDFVKDFSCNVCENKNVEVSADFYCETCLKGFCEKCLFHHDQIYFNHLKYGRGETNKWPLAKTMEDLLLKCDVHSNKKLKMFCLDHGQLCCSDCVLLNHRQCSNLTPISESARKLSVDIEQLSNKIETVLAELNNFKITQEASIQTVEGSLNEKLQEIRELRKKLNSALDELENTTLKELDEIRTTLQTSLKKHVECCSKLKDELQQLNEAVQGLCDKNKKELEFLASRKCLEKIQESETYLKESPVKMQSSMIFQANIDIAQYLSQQYSLGRIAVSMQSLSLKMIPDLVLTVKRKSEYNVKVLSDTSQTCSIVGICSLPSGQFIAVDITHFKVKLLDKHYNVISDIVVSRRPWSICQITSIEVAVSLDHHSVQFVSVINGQLVNGRKLQLQHDAIGIAHHQGALYITSCYALYHYTLTGTLVKKIYEDITGGTTVCRCALSPAGDRIYVTSPAQHKLITLATDGSLISTFSDPALPSPCGVHVTPAGQLLVCVSVCGNGAVIQVDCEGRKKLATLYSHKDVKSYMYPLSACSNTITDQIIVGLSENNNIIVMDLQQL